MRVRLTQRVNHRRASQRLANLNLKIAYYNHTQGAENGYLDMLAFSRINGMKISNKAVVAYADSLLLARGLNPSQMNTSSKAMTLYGDVVDKQMVELMEHRNRTIREYMSFQHQDIPEGAFEINAVVLEDMKNYAGKDRFTVTLLIDDETIELPVEEDTFADEDYYDAYALEDEPVEETMADDAMPAQEELPTQDNIPAEATLDSAEEEIGEE